MRNIVVYGASFAGFHVARRLERDLEGRRGVELTVIIDRNRLVYRPLLPHVASGTVEPRTAECGFRGRLAGEARIVRDSVASIDLDARRVDGESDAYEWDVLVVAPPPATDWRGRKEWRRYAQPLHTVADARSIRRRVGDTDWADRPPVVVGAGPTGVGLAAEIASSVEIPPILVERASKLLPEAPDSIRRPVRRRLEDLGVRIRTDSEVTDCSNDGVEIDDQRTLEARATWWCGGIRPPKVLAESNLPTDDRHRVRVEPTLEVEGRTDVFAVGYGAMHAGGVTSTLRAQANAGEIAAKNAQASLDGRGFIRREETELDWLVPLGDGAALATIRGEILTGRPGGVVYRGVHLSLLPGSLQKVRLAREWLSEGLQSADSLERIRKLLPK